MAEELSHGVVTSLQLWYHHLLAPLAALPGVAAALFVQHPSSRFPALVLVGDSFKTFYHAAGLGGSCL
jgi:hypothetical protein